MNLRPFLMATLLGVLAGCASAPTPEMRHADRLPDTEAGTASSGTSSAGPEIRREVLQELGSEGPKPVIRRGSTLPINRAAATAPPPSLTSSGEATFNFEGESLHAVV